MDESDLSVPTLKKMASNSEIEPMVRSRCVPSDINCAKCFICQTTKYPKEKYTTSSATEPGITSIINSAAQRRKYNDDSFIETLDRLDVMDISKYISDVCWHRTCYSDFTNKTDINRLCKRISNPLDHTDLHPPGGECCKRRSFEISTDWLKCIFCQKGSTKVKQILTFDVSDRILRLSKFDSVLRCRLSDVTDLIAAEGKYHLKCYVGFLRELSKHDDTPQMEPESICFQNTMQDIRKGVARGNIYSLKNVWDYYSSMVSDSFQIESGPYRSNRFKERVQAALGKSVSFILPLVPTESQLIVPSSVSGDTIRKAIADLVEGTDMKGDASESDPILKEDKAISMMQTVAIQLHNDIHDSPGHNFIGAIDNASMEKVVPERLYMFVRLLCAGDMVEDDANPEESLIAENLRRRVLSICQDLVFLVSNGKKLTPKHIGIGMTVHQATRSKDLVRLLHAAGHSISYDQVRRIDNSIANDVLARKETENGVLIPRGIHCSSELGYIRFAADNIDINEETLSGAGTFHATQATVIKRKTGTMITPLEINLNTSRHLNNVGSSGVYDIIDANMSCEKPPLVFYDPVPITLFTENRLRTLHDASIADYIWLLCRKNASDDQHVPGWSGFNQLLSINKTPITTVAPLPIINAVAHDFSTLWTVITHAWAIANQTGALNTVMTLDEQLYCKAKMLQWDNAEICKDVIFMLGGFHTQMNFSKVIGQHMECSGLLEILTESEVFGAVTASNIIKGKNWNRVLRAHKLMIEALWQEMWPLFLEWIEDENNPTADICPDVSDLISCITEHRAEAAQQEFHSLANTVKEFPSILSAFDKHHQSNSTIMLWRCYMDLVGLLLALTRAIRDGNWSLYLSTFTEMLPWFAVYDHVHYFRWGMVFLADMSLLPLRAPKVYAGFTDGDFVTKESHQKFSQIPDDQALEHINKVGKVAGGLIGISQTDSARDRWCLTYSERAQIAEETKRAFLVSTATDDIDSEYLHKDWGPKRLQRDKDDVMKLRHQIQKYRVFDRKDLMNVVTGDIATDNITKDLLGSRETGGEKVTRFFEDRFVTKEINIHDSIKLTKSNTFASLYNVPVTVGNNKRIELKADGDFMRRVVIALESGRVVDVDKLLECEISPVPTSIATTDRMLRIPSNKSDLSKILQKCIPQRSYRTEESPTCVIVDGMAVVQLLGNQSCSTFGSWVEKFTKYIFGLYDANCTRVDLVFDRYESPSIKDDTRKKRRRGNSNGVKCSIQSRGQKIGNWDRLMTVQDNKASLANFICQQMTQIPSGGFTNPLEVWSSREADTSRLVSNQEEADTRIILHARDAKCCGFEQVKVLCSDTDVLVLLLYHRDQLSKNIWMETAPKKNKRLIPVHEIDAPESIRASVLGFHALTGCDTTSQFMGIGKQTSWNSFVKCSALLVSVGDCQYPSDRTFCDVEEFVCRLYSPSSTIKSINSLRSQMFRSKKSLRVLPPTKDALTHHIQRAHYQTYIWRHCLLPGHERPDLQKSGWYLDGTNTLHAVLMTKDPISSECVDLTTCGCSGRCSTRRCKCTRLNMICTKACSCQGDCDNPMIVAQDRLS